MKISIITPSHNNLEYLKQCHKSLIDHIPKSIEWEHCIADDGSFDNTLEWIIETSKIDNTIKYIHKEKQTGHTELYNTLVNEISTGDVIFIFHADMFLVSKNTIPNMLKDLREKVIVSAMRVEPIGMYPPSPEKELIDFGGLYIENLDINKVTNKIKQLEEENKNSIVNSIFAPWMCYKKDYLNTDLIYSPFPREDSDQFNRFILSGYKTIQINDALVCHWCSRGHRKTNKDNPIEDNEMFIYYANKATRNYTRKWQAPIKFKEYQYPIVSPVYDIGFVINNCYNENLLSILEPWCSTIYIEDQTLINNYIKKEQSETLFDLTKRVKHISELKTNDILIEFDSHKINNNNIQYIGQLSDIIKDSGQIGQFELDIFKFDIKNLNTYEKLLIHTNDSYYQSKLLKSC